MGGDGSMAHVSHPNGRDSTMSGIFNSYAEANRIYNDTRITRIRSALFGEASTSDAIPTRSSIVDKLTLPAQRTKDAVLRLLQFEGPTDVNYMGVPELVKMMNEGDDALMAQAVRRVYLLSKEDRTIATYPSLVESLVNAVKSEDPNVRLNAAAALSHISERREGCMHIFRSGGLAELIKMLYNSVESVVHYAVTTLRNLLIYIPEVRVAARSLAALDGLSPLLCRTNPKLLAQVADSIYYLLLDDPLSKTMFLAQGSPSTLLKIMKDHSNHRKLMYTVIRCIRSLSVDHENKLNLILLGFIPVLYHELCKTSDYKTRLAILVSIRNLSDSATNEENLSPLVVYLLDLLRETAECPYPISEDDEVTKKTIAEAATLSTCATGILSNLTCNNTNNKDTVCRSLGIEALLAAIRRYPDEEDITEPALCAIRHCTARHRLCGDAQDRLRLCGSFPLMLSLLATFRAPIIKAVLGIIRNSALHPKNLEVLPECRIDLSGNTESFVSLIVAILNGAVQNYREDKDAAQDGVHMFYLIEGAVSALHQLAAHPAVAAELYQNADLLALVQDLLAMTQELLHNPGDTSQPMDEVIERELLGLLYQLTKTIEGVRAVEMFGFTELLMDSLRSQHKSVATYASGVLKNMQSERPVPYRQDLDAELSSGWQRDGLEPELFGEMYPVHGLDGSQFHLSQNNSSWFDTDL